MGELLAGIPAPRIGTAVSLPLDLVSVLSLLHRATPETGLDPWLIETRRALPADLRGDLDLLHGFSGRLLYYVEEPVMRFEPLRPDRLAAGFAELRAFLSELPAAAYLEMASHALSRVHADLRRPFLPPAAGHREAWRSALGPALTSASMDDALALVSDPERLKGRTVALFERFWDGIYRDVYAAHRAVLAEAARVGRSSARGDVEAAFTDLTGHQPPPMPASVDRVRCVTFCPSAFLGSFVSYILFPPDLVVFFDAAGYLGRSAPNDVPPPRIAPPATGLRTEDLLEVARAMADPTRLRVLDLLADGELYAQEIVGRLGIAQSAVSRHLAQLERAGLVEVRARRGLKFYAVNAPRFAAVADAFRARADNAPPRKA